MFVNGPVNVVRMEGYIGKIKKVIYIYFDFHFPTNMQTRCNSINSIDITKYLASTFKKLESQNKIYDFFLENDVRRLTNYQHGFAVDIKINKRTMYIIELAKMFNINFGNRHVENNTIDPVDKKTVLKKTNALFKTRFHYVDIRDLFGVGFINWNHTPINIINNISRYYSLSDQNYTLVETNLTHIKNYATHIVELFENDNIYIPDKVNKYHKKNPSDNNIDYKETVDTRNYFIHKIKNIYTNNLVKTQINDLIDDIKNKYKKNIKAIDIFLKQFTLVYELLKNKNKLQFDDKINLYCYGMSTLKLLSIVQNLRDLYYDINFESEVWIMDLYSLRRILDKNYITNSIIYCGAHHSINYVYVLSKNFDFKITHASYSATNLETLNHTIKDCTFDNLDRILSENLYPPKFSQCSNMTNFPPDFS